MSCPTLNRICNVMADMEAGWRAKGYTPFRDLPVGATFRFARLTDRDRSAKRLNRKTSTGWYADVASYGVGRNWRTGGGSLVEPVGGLNG